METNNEIVKISKALERIADVLEFIKEYGIRTDPKR